MGDMMIFELNNEAIAYIVDELNYQCLEMYGRRIKGMRTQVDYIHSSQDVAVFNVSIVKGGVVKKQGKFTFQPYSDGYWDEDDFYQHIRTSVVRFVKEL